MVCFECFVVCVWYMFMFVFVIWCVLNVLLSVFRYMFMFVFVIWCVLNVF